MPRDNNRNQLSPHFFNREEDGSVRLRIRFSPEEATQIEEAAGGTPLMLYIHRVLNASSAFHIRQREEEAAKQQQEQAGEGDVAQSTDDAADDT